MSATKPDDRGDDASPGPANPLAEPRNVARLKTAIAIMSVLLVAGTVVVIGTIVYRALTHQGKSASPAVGAASPYPGFPRLDVEVERGALVNQIEIDGDRMAVHVTGAVADEILILDIRSGELIGRVGLKEKPIR